MLRCCQSVDELIPSCCSKFLLPIEIEVTITTACIVMQPALILLELCYKPDVLVSIINTRLIVCCELQYYGQCSDVEVGMSSTTLLVLFSLSLLLEEMLFIAQIGYTVCESCCLKLSSDCHVLTQSRLRIPSLHSRCNG